MDALEQYLKIEKMDPTQITEGSIKHKETKYSEMSSQFSEVENKGKAFIKEAEGVSVTHTERETEKERREGGPGVG